MFADSAVALAMAGAELSPGLSVDVDPLASPSVLMFRDEDDPSATPEPAPESNVWLNKPDFDGVLDPSSLSNCASNPPTSVRPASEERGLFSPLRLSFMSNSTPGPKFTDGLSTGLDGLDVASPSPGPALVERGLAGGLAGGVAGGIAMSSNSLVFPISMICGSKDALIVLA
jgi:hypothetical protein